MATRFWRGFAVGAGVGAGAGISMFLLMNSLVGARKRRVIRLEKSLQIGQPVHEVFEAWSNLDRLPQISDYVQNIHHDGNRSHWIIQIDGRSVEWDAEIEQFIPDQAIGWKSLNGPKHTGRITFAPIANDNTLVHLTMNYAPPLRLLKPFVENASGLLENYVERVLRDFKSALEGKGQEGRRPPVRASGVGPGTGMTQTDISRATGTYGTSSPAAAGSTSPAPSREVVDRFGKPANPVEYSSPPEAKR